MWDAAQYLKYADERARPFFDLLARVQRAEVAAITDLGCGPGTLTRTLIERWPRARVIGVDSAPEMLEQARPLAMPGRLTFVEGDIRSWSPETPQDLIISNAALQWVSDHEALLGRLTALLSPGGTLAVQVPYHFQNPAHLAIEATKADRRWRAALESVGLNQHSVKPLVWYVERLYDLDFTVDAWQTTYLHVLTGADPVLEWFKGTALRPLLERLDERQQSEFLQTLGARFQADHPSRDGKTLLPFPRLFFVATRT